MTESADVLRDDELLIHRTFDAPAALVFRLWEQCHHHVRAGMHPVATAVHRQAADLPRVDIGDVDGRSPEPGMLRLPHDGAGLRPAVDELQSPRRDRNRLTGRRP
jgi:hypothetical protein